MVFLRWRFHFSNFSINAQTIISWLLMTWLALFVIIDIEHTWFWLSIEFRTFKLINICNWLSFAFFWSLPWRSLKWLIARICISSVRGINILDILIWIRQSFIWCLAFIREDFILWKSSIRKTSHLYVYYFCFIKSSHINW